jgi:excisionase family DNA binding protein
MKLITAQEVAKILNVDESTVRVNAKKGRLGFRSIRVGSLWKFPEDEVYQYVYGDKWREMMVVEQPVEMKTLELRTKQPANVIPLSTHEVANENTTDTDACSE